MTIQPLTRILARIRRIARFEVHAYWRRQPIRASTVLYESFAGNGMLCNPEAIFRDLLGAPDMAHLNRSVQSEFSRDPRVTIVRYGSAAYLRALATSQYLINNATFPPDFAKRPGQQYINTWHGTPLKKMGYDMPGGAKEAANVIRNFVAADYLLSANPVMTDMYWRAYCLKGIYRGTIIEEGYPRIDRQVLTSEAITAERTKLIEAGLPIGDRKIILYAPTWKGATFARPTDDLDALADNVAELAGLINSDEYVVLLKTHQSIYSLGRDRPDVRDTLVPNNIPTNVVLGLTTILVTDYSSIAGDFLATGRPILYFIPDFAEYDGTRGLYADPDDWPGPICTSVQDLANAISSVSSPSTTDQQRYRATTHRIVPYEDGHSTRRIVDIIFRGIRGGARLHKGADDGRTSMLIYLGGMRSNGITSSALNLLTSLDHDRFDVSVFYPATATADSLSNQLAIDARVRQFPRVGGMNGSKVDQFVRYLDYRRGRIRSHNRDARRQQLWDDEWTRCFGPDTRFDHVVDFSGYGPFWAALLLHAPGAIRSIWLHNDLAADAHRVIRGRKRMRHSLTQIFTLYDQFDHLVSVSAELSEINYKSLAEYGTAAKFTSAPNAIDSALIGWKARQPIDGPAADFLARPKMTTFVSVGRLSPEKNHARLIRAFAQVNARNPATQLLIVGDGPLASDLRDLANDLRLGGAVLLSGHSENPYALMAAASCFVLSSDYEGQPMVLLEARVIGIPIVTVDFASVTGALPPGAGLVVEQDDAALAAGMESYLAGRVPTAKFNPSRYQSEAVAAFCAAVGAPELTPPAASGNPPHNAAPRGLAA
jgi:CDP-glycerol glycerophosphotransferase (TagB/SpsB family)/glycosyltransferase involved in cell wall biosynthesis